MGKLFVGFFAVMFAIAAIASACDYATTPNCASNEVLLRSANGPKVCAVGHH